MPVWKRPPVSVANGLCHPKALDPGSSHPTKPLRASAGTPTGRDDTAYSLMCFVLGLVVIPNGAMQAPIQYRRSLNRLVSRFHLSTTISKRLDPGSSHPTKPLRASARPRQAGMTQYRVDWGLFRASFPPSNILLILSILSSAFYLVFTITTPPRHHLTTRVCQGNLSTISPFHLSTA